MRSLDRLKKIRKKALIIAAHPDDESLFMGGTIAEFKNWSWTVLCVTDCDERYNKMRIRELFKACDIYNAGGSKAKAVCLGIRKKKGVFSEAELLRQIGGFIKESGPFDVLFTHNSEGDYGHGTHKSVHSAVKQLKSRNIYNFAAPCGQESLAGFPVAPKGNPQSVRLSARSLRIKKKAINVYLKGSQKSNLSRLKGLVTFAVSARVEFFHKYN